VNPPIAETTTTGRARTADRTMPATLRKALVSSTDVPPNFMIVGFIDKHLECAGPGGALDSLGISFKAATSRRTP